MICFDRMVYPLIADIYYSVVAQSEYGTMTPEWLYDRQTRITLQATGEGSYKTENVNAQFFKPEIGYIIHMPKSPLINSEGRPYAVDEIMITNIRDADLEYLFIEGTGTKEGMPTRFAIETCKPVLDPFGRAEAYKLSIVRMQDQDVALNVG